MSEFKLHDNLANIGFGIEACLEKKLELPALVLIYSGIDIAGWLASPSPDEFASDRTFMEWADAYLLKATTLRCTALDLWGARCGIVHILTPYSGPSKKGQPRIILPVYGAARAQDMQELIDLKGDSDRYVAVHVKELYEAWRLGVLRFLEELEEDPGKKERVYTKARKFFSVISPDLLNQALAQFEKKV